MLTPIIAHPGRTDSSGCHTCRTNCSSWGLADGEYHCHNAPAPAPTAPTPAPTPAPAPAPAPAPELVQAEPIPEPTSEPETNGEVLGEMEDIEIAQENDTSSLENSGGSCLGALLLFIPMLVGQLFKF